jgi:histidyl-tRNA synthetase
MSRASLPKGTRDFLPGELIRRKYIFGIIESTFIKYGYLPIETPAMEALETLTGKYGEEGDKLLFKILNNGDYLAKADANALNSGDSNALTPSIAKRGLRYDLTVPFARYVVMHQNEIQLPFKRYQIQPVWRADRPQKGRYQEFYQCDVDVVGSDSLMYEAELVQIYHEVFERLGIHTTIKINNRKVLYGIAEVCGVADQFIDMTVCIDKLDKISEEAVIEEMVKRAIPEAAAIRVLGLLKSHDLDTLATHLEGSTEGSKGVAELREVLKYLHHSSIHNLQITPGLARGLSYYTGCIFEVAVDTDHHSDIRMGSIGGGGRYDDLTGSFGMKGVSGVGVSFGAERIYDVMEELGIFPESLDHSHQIIFIATDTDCHHRAFQYATQLRQAGVNCDIYPEPARLKKQLKYVNDRNFKYAAIIGEEEFQSGKITLKNMESGDQTVLTPKELLAVLK